MVAEILLGVIALALTGALLLRERIAQAERRDWARERGELIGRIQHPEQRVFVPPAPVALSLVPGPPPEREEVDESGLVGQDTSPTADDA